MMMATFVLGFVLVAMVLMLVFWVTSCVWLYQDSRLHGQEPVLWVLMAVFASPIVALLLYFIFGRKNTVDPCPACQYPVARSARYCPNCGTGNPAFGERPPRRRLSGVGKAALVTGAAGMVLLLCTFVGLIVFSISETRGAVGAVQVAGGSVGLPITSTWKPEVNTGWVIINSENRHNGVWNFYMSKTSDGYHSRSEFDLDDGQSRTLMAAVECEGERLDLELIQDGVVVETYTLSGAEGTQELSLAQCEPGTVVLRLVNHGAEQIHGTLWVE